MSGPKKANRVCIVFVGYPSNTIHERPWKRNTSMWSYWRLKMKVAATLENYGIEVSRSQKTGLRRCARHGCEVQRKPRGLVKCLHNHVMRADVNAAVNILARSGGKIPVSIKVLSFTPMPTGVTESKQKRKA